MKNEKVNELIAILSMAQNTETIIYANSYEHALSMKACFEKIGATDVMVGSHAHKGYYVTVSQSK